MAPNPHLVADSRLRNVGQRYTASRRRLVAALATAPAPLSIPEILAREPDLAQSSVYRSLSFLEPVGVVKRISGTGDFARYELADELTDHHHHHLVCTQCGAVTDVTLPAEVETSLGQAIDALEGQTGFRTDQHRVDLMGRCAGCAAPS